MDQLGKACLDMGPVEPQVGKGTVQERGMSWVPHRVGTDLASRGTVPELQGWRGTVPELQGWRGTVQVRLVLEGIHLGQQGIRETGPGLLGWVERDLGQTAQSEETQVLLVEQGLLRVGNEGHQGPHQASQDYWGAEPNFQELMDWCV